MHPISNAGTAPRQPHFNLDAALDLARRGFAVFPCKARGKAPLLSADRGGRGCLDATRDPTIIKDWWTRVPRANIGIATGAPSGALVLDVDPRHGGDEALDALERAHGLLPHTVVCITGGGGMHIYFRHAAGIHNSIGEKGGIAPGLDVRTSGGYVIAPPSLHESGRLYAWDVDNHPDETAIAEAPRWLVALARKPAKSDVATLPETWRRLVADGVGAGARNTAIARLAGHLLRHGIDPFVALDLLRTWNAERCRPPLPDEEVVRTVDSIAAAELRRRAAA